MAKASSMAAAWAVSRRQNWPAARSRSQMARVTASIGREVGEEGVDLEGAGEAAADAGGDGGAGHVLAVEQDAARSSGGSWPVIRLMSVVLPAPFGPISAWRAPRGSVIETSRVTCERAEALREGLGAEAAGSVSVARSRDVSRHRGADEAGEAAEDAPGHDEDDDHEQEADPEVPVLRVHAGELVAGQHEDERAEDARRRAGRCRRGSA